MEFDKSFIGEHILETLQELLPQDDIVSRSRWTQKDPISRADTLPNQSVHSRPTHSEKYILREGIAPQSGGTEVVPSAQVMTLVLAVVTHSLMSLIVTYFILVLLLIVIIWFMVRKWWNSWKKSNQYSAYEKIFQLYNT